MAAVNNVPAGPQQVGRILTATELYKLGLIQTNFAPSKQEIQKEAALKLKKSNLKKDLSRNVKDHYTLGRQLGSGSFADVYEGICKVTGKKVAVKTIKVRDATHPEEREVALLEAATLKVLAHPNVVKFIDVF